MDKEKLYKLISSKEFICNLRLFVDKFKKSKSSGALCVEYKKISATGYLEPQALKDNFIKVLKDINTSQFLYWEAIHYIGLQALEKTIDDIDSYYYEIRCITGEVAEDDNGEELIYLDFNEANSICKSMNDEAEEILFKVYNSSLDKYVV